MAEPVVWKRVPEDDGSNGETLVVIVEIFERTWRMGPTEVGREIDTFRDAAMDEVRKRLATP